jgi:hypothetical protein
MLIVGGYDIILDLTVTLGWIGPFIFAENVNVGEQP